MSTGEKLPDTITQIASCQHSDLKQVIEDTIDVGIGPGMHRYSYHCPECGFEFCEGYGGTLSENLAGWGDYVIDSYKTGSLIITEG